MIFDTGYIDAQREYDSELPEEDDDTDDEAELEAALHRLEYQDDY